MGKSKHICDHCDGNIVEYYDDRYKGIRGKCLHCEVDFPLE